MSACVVLAWCLLALVAAAGTRGPDHPAAQANISIASSTQAVLTSESVTAANARAGAGPAQQAARWTVRPGDTLSAIAAARGRPEPPKAPGTGRPGRASRAGRQPPPSGAAGDGTSGPPAGWPPRRARS